MIKTTTTERQTHSNQPCRLCVCLHASLVALMIHDLHCAAGHACARHFLLLKSVRLKQSQWISQLAARDPSRRFRARHKTQQLVTGSRKRKQKIENCPINHPHDGPRKVPQLLKYLIFTRRHCFWELKGFNSFKTITINGPKVDQIALGVTADHSRKKYRLTGRMHHQSQTVPASRELQTI